MPAGIPTLIRSVVSRVFPQAVPDTTEASARLWHDQSLATTVIMPDFKAMADEGTYFEIMQTPSFIANAIAGNIATALTDTTPTLFIQNTNPAGTPPKRVYLDRVSMTLSVIPGANTNLQYAWKVDPIARTCTGGTTISGIANVGGNVNTDSANVSKTISSCGVLTAGAASASSRVVSAGVIRPTTTAPAGAIGDVFHFKFGGIDPGPTAYISALTVALPLVQVLACPPIILGPGASAALYIWGTLMATTAPSWWPEIAYGER